MTTQFGASFSHPHLKYLGVDPTKAIKEYKKLNLKWIRLGCYWSEIEKEEGKFNFLELDKLVNFCEKGKINIVLTLGLKAPRWPEYYIPGWLEKKLNLSKKDYVFSQNDEELFDHLEIFIKTCINHYKNNDQIKVWQIENEPFETFGPYKRKIDTKFLKKEVKIFKDADSKRRICLTFGTGSIIKSSVFFNKIILHHIIALDLYFKSEINIANHKIIIGKPKILLNALIRLTRIINNYNNEFWITELQSEPWETDGYNIKNPKSFSLENFKKNTEFALKLDPEVILFWGFEYWLWRKIKYNDDSYLKKAQEIINKYAI